MGAGFQPTATDVNNMAGNLSQTVNRVMEQIGDFQIWLLATPDATLIASPYNMLQADVTSLKSAFVDLDKLRTIYQGVGTQAALYDFRTFAKRLYGFGF